MPAPAPNIGVILCGGLGERFWPLSHEGRPKYALEFDGKRTLLAATYDRLRRVHEPSAIYVITDRPHAKLVKKLLPGLSQDQVLAEPCRRNTAGAVTLATLAISKLRGPDALLSFYPADAAISDAARFAATLKKAQAFALAEDRIVLVGVPPVYPATGYGYIEAGKTIGQGRAVASFVEKPALPEAKKLLESGRFLWNSGIFTWKASVFREELRAHAPDYARAFDAVFAKTPTESALATLFRKIPVASIDRLLIEKSRKLAVFAADFDWDDVGTWEALRRIAPDSKGNVLKSRGVFDDVQNTVIFCEDLVVVATGLRDVVIAQKGQYLLVSGPGKSQEIPRLKKAVLDRGGRKGR